MRILEVIAVGLGATLCIDAWSMLLKSAFGVRSLDYCLLGRWILHMPKGKFSHDTIADSAKKSHECKIGWTAHYSIGVGFSALFVLLMSERWLAHPSLLPALAFGIGTVAIPFFVMQPALGLGIASSRARSPNAARAKSVATHAIFGIGLYLWAVLLNPN
jgi:hypothetical protein